MNPAQDYQGHPEAGCAKRDNSEIGGFVALA
jgi:hypothetical protein